MDTRVQSGLRRNYQACLIKIARVRMDTRVQSGLRLNSNNFVISFFMVRMDTRVQSGLRLMVKVLSLFGLQMSEWIPAFRAD